MHRVGRTEAVALALLALSGTVLHSASSAAQTPPTRQGAQADPIEAAMSRGDAAMDSGRPADALAAYEEAYALEPRPALLYNRGRAQQALEHYPEALDLLEQFERTAPPQLLAKVPALKEVIREVRGRVTTLVVRCDVVGAQVRLRGQVVGVTPIAAGVRVSSGAADLEVLREGHETYSERVVLPGGGSLDISVKLETKDARATLRVTSATEGARAIVDGADAGSVPFELRLQPGPHRVRLEKSGFAPTEATVSLSAMERREMSLHLDREKTVLERWWFWTGVGVLVAGGVTAAVLAATQEPTPKSGSIAPGVIAFPSGFRF